MIDTVETVDSNAGGDAPQNGGRKLVGWIVAVLALFVLAMSVSSDGRWSEDSVREASICLVDGLRTADESGKCVTAVVAVADVLDAAAKARQGDPADLSAAVREVVARAGLPEGSAFAATLAAVVCSEINRAHEVGVDEGQYLYRVSVIAGCLRSAASQAGK